MPRSTTRATTEMTTQAPPDTSTPQKARVVTAHGDLVGQAMLLANGWVTMCGDDMSGWQSLPPGAVVVVDWLE